MALRTEAEYENLFGDYITLLTTLNRDELVRPMKQVDETRAVLPAGDLLVGLKPTDDWCAYHVKFDVDSEEPRVLPDQKIIKAKRFLRVEFNFYGPNASNNCLNFKQLHYIQAAYDQLIKSNIVFANVGQDTMDLDFESNGKWWTRRIIIIDYLETVEIEFSGAKASEIAESVENIIRIDSIE